MKSRKHSYEIKLAWGEMDAFGHVNNAVYFRHIETGRSAYFTEIGIFDFMKKHQIGPILAETTLKFIQPLVYPDTIQVVTEITKVKNTSFLMDFKIISKKLGLAAKGNAVIVMVDYKIGKKTLIPEEIKKIMIN